MKIRRICHALCLRVLALRAEAGRHVHAYRRGGVPDRELAPASGADPSRGPSALALLPLSAAAQSVPPATLPQGGQVVQGSAAITVSSASQMIIHQRSPQAIIDWNGFSIGANSLLQILQPSAASAILNRVTGGDLSAIYGQLQANGHVFLINPHGIVIGPTGRIDAGALVASTLNTSNASFMAGTKGGALSFGGDSHAGIVNLGAVRTASGDIVLIAPSVTNRGSLFAPQGTAALASGSEVYYAPAGDDHILVLAPVTGAGGAGITNAGVIRAAQAELKAAGSPYALAVNNGGTVSATSLTRAGGRVILDAGTGDVTNGGTLTARQGDAGGAVDVLGANVALTGSTVVDASGQTGGGTVRIGGGAHGDDATVHNAETTTVEAGAAIRADATSNGNGGSVVVWSDNRTSFGGTILARGGAQGGHGGSAEVSGRTLRFGGRADLDCADGHDRHATARPGVNRH